MLLISRAQIHGLYLEKVPSLNRSTTFLSLDMSRADSVYLTYCTVCTLHGFIGLFGGRAVLYQVFFPIASLRVFL